MSKCSASPTCTASKLARRESPTRPTRCAALWPGRARFSSSNAASARGVISWALLLAVPLMVPVAILTLPSTWSGIAAPAWIGLAYVSIFSMFVGFIFWYRGLAIGGIARVGQLQQLQPFFGLALAGLLLHEPVAWSMIAATALVVACVFFARRFA